MKKIFAELAYKHPTRKFMQIKATKCIQNFQDVDVPCLLFYKDGELFENMSGFKTRNIFGGKHATT